MNYRRTDNPDYTASTEKDILIATMKKELYQIRDLEHEHSKLVDEVKNLESKYSMLQEDNLRTENELKYSLPRAQDKIRHQPDHNHPAEKLAGRVQDPDPQVLGADRRHSEGDREPEESVRQPIELNRSPDFLQPGTIKEQPRAGRNQQLVVQQGIEEKYIRFGV